MGKTIWKQYEHLNNAFYRNAEVYHFAAMHTLIPGEATYQEIDLLLAIHKLSKVGIKNPNQIAENRKMDGPALSNYLLRLEKLGYITRSRNEDSQRNVDVAITEYGLEIIHTIGKYYDAFKNKILKHFGVLKLVSAIKLSVRISNHISDLDPIVFHTLHPTHYTKYLVDSLSNIYFEFNNKDVEYLKAQESIKSIREFIVLHAIYIEGGKATLTGLVNYLMLPLTTAASIVNRLEERSLIIRERSLQDGRKFHFQLTKEGKESVQSYMEMRVKFHMKIKEIMSEKEYQMVLEVFQILFGHTMDYLQEVLV